MSIHAGSLQAECDRRIAMAEERVRQHENANRAISIRLRQLAGENAALRHELSIHHGAQGATADAVNLFRALSDRAYLLSAIRTHRSRYAKQRRSTVHQHDAALYAVMREVETRSEEDEDEPDRNR